MATLEEMISELKAKVQTLREMENRLSAKLQQALREKKHPEGWVELDARVVRLRAECSRLRKRVMRRVETKSKLRQGRKKKGVPSRHAGTPPPPVPPLFSKQG